MLTDLWARYEVMEGKKKKKTLLAAFCRCLVSIFDGIGELAQPCRISPQR